MSFDNFHAAALDHFQNPPDTWTVKEVASDRWALARTDGGIMDTYTTEAAATGALDSGTSDGVRVWQRSDDWYREKSTQHRRLTAQERATVSAILAELERH